MNIILNILSLTPFEVGTGILCLLLSVGIISFVIFCICLVSSDNTYKRRRRK